MDFLTNNTLYSFKIDTILSVHSFTCNTPIKGLSRGYDFLEFIYVEKGEIDFTSNTGSIRLHKGEIFFHNSNIVYSISPTSDISSTIISASFITSSQIKQFFEKNTFRLDRKGELVLNDFILEAYNSYDSDIESYFKPYMTLVPAASFGAEHMLRLHLELLLLHIIRKYHVENKATITTALIPSKTHTSINDDELFHRISSYMDDNINQKLSLEKICKDNLISHSKLQKLFKTRTGKGAIDYFIEQKIEIAKLLISENGLNFTQISEYLGYSSVHFFSRQFKKVTGMTPSEFAEINKTFL